MNAGADAKVGAAAADVAGHGVVDVFVGGLGIFGEEGGSGHELAGLTVAALGDVEFTPSFLEGMGSIGREALDGDDGLAADAGDRSHAGLDGLTAYMDGAGAALADAATEFGANEVEVIAEHPQERGLGSHVHGAGLAVNLEGELSHGS